MRAAAVGVLGWGEAVTAWEPRFADALTAVLLDAIQARTRYSNGQEQDGAMGHEGNREAMLRFFESYNRRDFGALGDDIDEDFVYDQLPDDPELGQGRDAFLQFLRLYLEPFPDEHIEVLDTVAEGDLVAVRARATATHRSAFMGIPASGNPVTLEVARFARFNEAGKVIEAWGYQDNLAFMQQIDAMPNDPGS